MGVHDRLQGEVQDGDDDLYIFQSKPTTPGERTPDLLVRFQAVAAERSDVKHEIYNVRSNTRLTQVRRTISKDFQFSFSNGFIFLKKKKEVLRSDEKYLTLFDILPKYPHGKPSKNFQYPSIEYKKVFVDYDGKRYGVMCACIVYLFEQSTVSHWPEKSLHVELSANSVPGFSFIPADITSWTGELLEMHATLIHSYAATGDNDNLKNALEQVNAEKYSPMFMCDHRRASPLHYAAQNGHIDTCEFLVTSLGKDFLYYKDTNGKTPLHLALYWKRFDVVAYCLQFDPDLDVTDSLSNTCTSLLSQLTARETFKVLKRLQIDCVSNRVLHHFANTALSVQHTNFSQITTRLLKPSNTKLDLGMTPLHLAAILGDETCVRNLLDNGFDIHARDEADLLPLHYASKHGHGHIYAPLFIDTISTKDINKCYRMMLREGRFQHLKQLVSLKPRFEVECETMFMVMDMLNPRMNSVWNHLLPFFEVDKELASTYLLESAREGRLGAIKLLISIGARIDIQDMMGRTALHEAAQMGRTKVVEFLLKNSANPNITDERNASPLHYACAAGKHKTVKMMLNFPTVNAGLQDVSGRTPLLEAANRKKHRVVDFLLTECMDRINPQASDVFGYNIFHYTVNMKLRTVNFLLRRLPKGNKQPVQIDDFSAENKSISRRDEMAWLSRFRVRQDTTYEFKVKVPESERLQIRKLNKEKKQFKYNRKVSLWKKYGMKQKKLNGRPPAPDPFTNALRNRSDGKTPLHLAVIADIQPLVQKLVEFNKDDATVADESLSWPISVAVRKLHPLITLELMKSMSLYQQSCPIDIYFKHFPWTTGNKDTSSMIHLVMKHCQTGIQTVESNRSKWLQTALRHGQIATVKKLLHYHLVPVRDIWVALNTTAPKGKLLDMLLNHLETNFSVTDYTDFVPPAKLLDRLGPFTFQSNELTMCVREALMDYMYWSWFHNLSIMKLLIYKLPSIFREYKYSLILAFFLPENGAVLKQNPVDSENVMVTFVKSEVWQEMEVGNLNTDEVGVRNYLACFKLAVEHKFWRLAEVLLDKVDIGLSAYISCLTLHELEALIYGMALGPKSLLGKFMKREKKRFLSMPEEQRMTLSKSIRLSSPTLPVMTKHYHELLTPLACIFLQYRRTPIENDELQLFEQAILYLGPTALRHSRKRVNVSGLPDKGACEDRLTRVLRSYNVSVRENVDEPSWLHTVALTCDLHLVKAGTKNVNAADINQKGETEVGYLSPLDIAALYGQLDVLKYLLDIGAKADAQTILCCCREDPQIIDEGCMPLKEHRKTALDLAEARIECLKLIFQKKPDSSINANKGSALLAAVENKRWSVLHYIFNETGVDIKYLFYENNSMVTRMFYENGTDELCRTIHTAVAIRLRTLRISSVLESFIGASYRKTDNVLLQLISIMKPNVDKEMILALLKERDKAGNCLLHVLAQRNHVEAIGKLLQLLEESSTCLEIQAIRKIVNPLDRGRRTPLWYAIRLRHFDVAEILYYHNATVGPTSLIEFLELKRKQCKGNTTKPFVRSMDKRDKRRKAASHKRNNSSAVTLCISYKEVTASLKPNDRAQKQKQPQCIKSQKKSVRSAKTDKTSDLQINSDSMPQKIRQLNKFANTAEQKMCSLLQEACEQRDVRLVKTILKHSPLGKNILDGNGNDVNLYAASSGSTEITDLLITNQSKLSLETLEKCITEVLIGLLQLHTPFATRKRFIEFFFKISQRLPDDGLTLYGFFFDGRLTCNSLMRCNYDFLLTILHTLVNQSRLENLSQMTLLGLAFITYEHGIDTLRNIFQMSCAGSELATKTLYRDCTLTEIVVLQFIATNKLSQPRLDAMLKALTDFTLLNINASIREDVLKRALFMNVWEVPCLAQDAFFEGKTELDNHWWWSTIALEAAKCNRVDMFRRMADNKAFSSSKESYTDMLQRCLCQAAVSCSYDVLHILFERFKLKTDFQSSELFVTGHMNNSRHWSLLQYAARGCNFKCVKRITSEMKEQNHPISMDLIVDSLELVCGNGDTACFDVILQMAKDRGIGMLNETENMRLFKDAAKHGHEALALKILSSNHPIDVQFQRGKELHPLHYCGMFGMPKLAKAIMAIDAKTVFIKDIQNCTPLHYAWQNGQIETMIVLTRSLSYTEIKSVSFDTTVEKRMFGLLNHLMFKNGGSQTNETVDILKSYQGNVLSSLDMTQATTNSYLDDHLALPLMDTLPLSAMLNMPEHCALFVHLCAMNGCINTLQRMVAEDLLQKYTIAIKPADLVSAALTHGYQNCGILLLNSLHLEKWERSEISNVLRTAIRRGHQETVELILSSGVPGLADEKSLGGLTPLAVAVSLGQHDILRALTNQMELETNMLHIQKHKDETDYTCPDCLLDMCIGWSKLFLGGNTCSGIEVKHQTALSSIRGISYGIKSASFAKRTFREQHVVDFVAGFMKTPNTHSNEVMKAVLFSMGTSGDVHEAMRLILQTKVGSLENAVKKSLSSESRSTTEYLAEKYVAETRHPSNSLLQTTAITGNIPVMQTLLSLHTLSENESFLPELAYAFGFKETGRYVQDELEKVAVQPNFTHFASIKGFVPPTVLWSSGLSHIGGEDWIESLADQTARLSNADVYLISNLQPSERANIEASATRSTIIPGSYNGKELKINIASFQRNTVLKECGSDVWLKCFLASQHVYGRVRSLLDSSDPKLANAPSVQVTCLSDVYGEPCKTTVEIDGSVTEAMSIKLIDKSPTVVHDLAPERRIAEHRLRTAITNQVVPDIETKFRTLLERDDIKIQIDWRSTDSRRPTTMYETLLKALAGEVFDNALAGLYDVFENCSGMVKFIETMHSKQTADMVISRLAGVKVIIVRFVDKCPTQEENKTSVRAIDSSIAWTFTLVDGELRYDRSSFMIWSVIEMNYSILSQIQASCIEIAGFRQGLTVDLDFRALVKLDSGEIVKSLFRGELSSEMAYLASNLSALLWYKPTIQTIELVIGTNNPSSFVQINDSTLKLEFALLGNAKNASIDKIDYTERLAEIEKRFLTQSVPPDFLSEPKSQAKELQERVHHETGFEVSVTIDENRLLMSCLSSMQRQLEHPLTCLTKCTLAAVQRLSTYYTDMIFYGVAQSPSCRRVTQLSIPNGLWFVPGGNVFRHPRKDTDYLIENVARTYIPYSSYNMLRPSLRLVSGNDINVQMASKICGIWECQPTSLLKSNKFDPDRLQSISSDDRLYDVHDSTSLQSFMQHMTGRKVVGPEAVEAAFMFFHSFFHPIPMSHGLSKHFTADHMNTITEARDMLIKQHVSQCHKLSANLVMNARKDLTVLTPAETLADDASTYLLIDNTFQNLEKKWNLFVGIWDCCQNAQRKTRICETLSDFVTIQVAYDVCNTRYSRASCLGKNYGESVDIFLNSPYEMQLILHHVDKEKESFVNTLEAAILKSLEMRLADMIHPPTVVENHTDVSELTDLELPEVNFSSNQSLRMNAIRRVQLAFALSIFDSLKNFIEWFNETHVYTLPITVQLLESESSTTYAVIASNMLMIYISQRSKSFQQLASAIGLVLIEQKATKRRDANMEAATPFHLHVEDAWLSGFSFQVSTLFDKPLKDNILNELCTSDRIKFTKDTSPLDIQPTSVVNEGDKVIVEFNFSGSKGKTDNHLDNTIVTVDNVPVKGFFPGFIPERGSWNMNSTLNGDIGITMATGCYFEMYIKHDGSCEVTNVGTILKQNNLKFGGVYRLVEKGRDVNLHMLLSPRRNVTIGPAEPYTLKRIRGERFQVTCLDSQRSMKLTASCRQCGQILRLWTPFKSILPGQMLRINVKK